MRSKNRNTRMGVVGWWGTIAKINREPEEGKFEIQYSYKTRDYYRHVAYATIPEDKIIYPE